MNEPKFSKIRELISELYKLSQQEELSHHDVDDLTNNALCEAEDLAKEFNEIPGVEPIEIQDEDQ